MRYKDETIELLNINGRLIQLMENMSDNKHGTLGEDYQRLSRATDSLLRASRILDEAVFELVKI